MKCEICGTPYKFHYPDSREIEEQCTCRMKKRKSFAPSCEKCSAPAKGGEIFVEGGASYHFCKHCSIILNAHPTMRRVHRFLNDELDLSDEDRAMIAARKRRASGQSPWKKSF